jgi:uncharacterized membrane protein YhaH (DUF805 family)
VRIPGFDKTPTAKLRRNRVNYVVIALLWVGFVVFTVVVNGETQASTWVGVVVIVIVLAAIVASEIELRRRAKEPAP